MSEWPNSVIPCPNPDGCNWPACPLECQWRPGKEKRDEHDGVIQVTERLGDAPIESEMRKKMNDIGDILGKALGKKWGFCLMVFPFEPFDGRCNYISNAKREDVVVLLKEQLARFQGQPEITGRA